jgi:decaprenylphospho-beta-D-ribofuranose 2-oxidase
MSAVDRLLARRTAAPAAEGPREVALTGWGRTAATRAEVSEPTTREQAVELVRGAGARGAVARGLGRSYGDAAQNAGGRVLDMTRMNRVLDVDLDTGTVVCEAGVSLHALIGMMLPFGYFVPVTPGTRYVTVGGAIGADIHGKNHHADGSFTQHVSSMDLLLADGTVRTVTPDGDPELFWATAGGMGLTGVVLTATLRMIPVRTARVRVLARRCQNLDEVMAAMAASDDTYRYSVAWVDCLAKGASLGRSVLEFGEHADVDELPAKHRADPLRFGARPLATAPAIVPSGLLNRRTVALFNEAWYRKAPKHEHLHYKSIPSFFHPLDGVRDWNRVYGPAGFLQYQYVAPFGSEDMVRRTLERISTVGAPSFLTVLKRFGPGSPGYLSFPMRGWTLALDFPTGTPGLRELLDWMDEQVLEVGGRVYLAKDSRLDADRLGAMYPRLEEFRKIRAQVDPEGVFVSDLSRRLDI